LGASGVPKTVELIDEIFNEFDEENRLAFWQRFNGLRFA
jgi:hypothetical protein